MKLSEPKKHSKILFINAAISGPGWNSMHPHGGNEGSYMFHGIAYVSAFLKSRGHTCSLLDLRKLSSWKHFEEAARQADYDYAFVSFLSLDAFTGACAIRSLKEVWPTRPVLVGGVHVSVCKDKVFPPDNFDDYYLKRAVPKRMDEYLAYKGEPAFDAAKFPKADCVVLGEGEIASAELVESDGPLPSYVEGGIIEDLGDLPHCDRDLFDNNCEITSPLLPHLPQPFITITFGRGCPYKCTFCATAHQQSSSKPRTKNVASFMDELEKLKIRYGKLGSLMIHDDVLFNAKWIEEWNIEIRNRFGYTPYWCQMRADFICKHPDLLETMAKCGMVWCSLGIESGSQRTLDFIKKQTTVEQNIKACEILGNLGINNFCNWMLGFPTETPEDVKATGDLIKQVKPNWHSANMYCNYPGTQLDKYIRENDLLLPSWHLMTHYPWQRTIKGVDYGLALRTRDQVCAAVPNHIVQPRYWSV